MPNDVRETPEIRDLDGAAAGLIAALFESADVMAGVFELGESDYRYLAANPQTAAFYGRTPAQMLGMSGADMGLPPEQIARRMARLRLCWDTQSPQTAEYPFEHGARSGWFLGTFAPVPGDAPRVGFVLVDITARKQAQLEAEQESRKLAVALDATGLGLWEYDIAADRVIWDARMRSLFGVGPDVEIDFALYQSRLAPEDADRLLAAYQAALQGENGGRYAVEHRTAAGRWVRGSGQVVFDAKGAPVRVLGTSLDLTAEVEARERQRLLMAELNHRVKNNLATVQSIAMQTARTSPDLQTFTDTFEGRIVSLARTHDVLTANAWSHAELGDVVARELDTVVDRVDVEGPAVSLGAVQALSLGMILHELTTNAAKHGAFSAAGGRARLTWSVAPEEVVDLTWRETGGPPLTGDPTMGFGTRLIRKLAAGDLRGEAAFAFEPSGLAFSLRFPAGA